MSESLPNNHPAKFDLAKFVSSESIKCLVYTTYGDQAVEPQPIPVRLLGDESTERLEDAS